MRTMHPVLKRGALFWDETLLPRTTYENRFERIQSKLVESGDNAWLLYGDVERYGDVAYFSNFLPRTRSAVCLIVRGSPPCLLVNVGERDIPAAKKLTWVEDVLPFSRLAPRLIEVLRSRGLDSSRLGLVGVEDAMPFSEWTTIKEEFPNIRWRDRTSVLRDLRRAKDATELEALRRSAAAIAKAFDRASEFLRPGLSLRELGARIDRDLRMAEAEDIRLLIGGACPHLISMRPPSDAVVQPGSTIAIYVAAEIQRYWAVGARTFSLKAPNRELQNLGDCVKAAFNEMRAAALPGARASELARLAERRLPEDCRAAARAFGFGHAIGLDFEEAPKLELSNVEILPENAAIVLQVICQNSETPIALAETIFLGRHGESPAGNGEPIACPISVSAG